MKIKDVEKIGEPLREQRVTHLMLVKLRSGISLSSIANGDDLFEFLQVLVEQNPVMLDIMQDVIDSRTRKVRLEPPQLLN